MRALHGVTFALELGELAAAEVLPMHERLPEGAGSSTLELRLRRGTAEEPAGTRAPLFFHGRTRAFLEASGAVSLTDGFTWLVVEGTRIEGTVDPRSLEDGYSFAHATMFIAVMIALRTHGLFHVHAGAVIDPRGRVVMIAGEGGSGKTTSTLALIAAGYDYLGDDAVLVKRSEGEIVLLDIPKPFHLHARSLAAYPALERHLGPKYRANHDKHVLDPRAAFAGRGRSSAAAPSVILFPRIADRAHTILEPMTQAEGMGELVGSGALAVVGGLAGVEAQLSIFRDLAGGARSFVLELGRDLLANPGVLARLLARVE